MEKPSTACLALAVVAGFSLGGCAYRAGFSERRIPGGYDLVAVPVFKNNTPEAGIETYFTNSFIRELERAKLARVVTKADSQATVTGSIDRVAYAAGSPIKSDNSKDSNYLPEGTAFNAEYRILVTVTLQLRRISA